MLTSVKRRCATMLDKENYVAYLSLSFQDDFYPPRLQSATTYALPYALPFILEKTPGCLFLPLPTLP